MTHPELQSEFSDMKSHTRRFLRALLGTGAIVLAGTNVSFADAIVTFQAEGGGLGANFTNATDGAGRQAHNVQRVRAVFLDLDGAPLAPVR